MDGLVEHQIYNKLYEIGNNLLLEENWEVFFQDFDFITPPDRVKKDKKPHRSSSQRRDSTKPRKTKSRSKRPSDSNECRSNTKKKKISLLGIDEDTKDKLLSILDEPFFYSSHSSGEYSDDEDINLDYESDNIQFGRDCNCTEAFCTYDSISQKIRVLSNDSKEALFDVIQHINDEEANKRFLLELKHLILNTDKPKPRQVVEPFSMRQIMNREPDFDHESSQDNEDESINNNHLAEPFFTKTGIPNPDAFMIVETDTSDFGYGGILKQRVDPESTKQLVHFTFGIWNSIQKNYCTIVNLLKRFYKKMETMRPTMRPLKLDSPQKTQQMARPFEIPATGLFPQRPTASQRKNIIIDKGFQNKDTTLADYPKLQVNTLTKLINQKIEQGSASSSVQTKESYIMKAPETFAQAQALPIMAIDKQYERAHIASLIKPVYLQNNFVDINNPIKTQRYFEVILVDT
ncbi:hypothetical protein H5410_027093 [Solanum commersonii]|uniref:Reverse transcriptase/retrotransposon-derived protein RNase H-like domain-containing protein n=1 Tax=Solanum commersonii TaxID=4109 RepID=A0A9J5YYA4_SOLCO|nr:hypothetical protein H5410_027093 [Solanum commersonii]